MLTTEQSNQLTALLKRERTARKDLVRAYRSRLSRDVICELIDHVETLEERLDILLDELADKAAEVLREAATVYQLYNDTQMPDGNLVDGQTLQELADLIGSDNHV